MLVGNIGIAHRHVPAGEIDHVAAVGNVPVMKGRSHGHEASPRVWQVYSGQWALASRSGSRRRAAVLGLATDLTSKSAQLLLQLVDSAVGLVGALVGLFGALFAAEEAFAGLHVEHRQLAVLQ